MKLVLLVRLGCHISSFVHETWALGEAWMSHLTYTEVPDATCCTSGMSVMKPGATAETSILADVSTSPSEFSTKHWYIPESSSLRSLICSSLLVILLSIVILLSAWMIWASLIQVMAVGAGWAVNPQLSCPMPDNSRS